jgi:hypothetical protein
MYTVTVGSECVFETENPSFARSVFSEWCRHATNPTSMAFELCVMMFGPMVGMLETRVTDNVDNSI